MKETIETILNGETEEEIQNPECYIHYADSTDIPEYIETHEDQRLEAELLNLEYDIKYGVEPKCHLEP